MIACSRICSAARFSREMKAMEEICGAGQADLWYTLHGAERLNLSKAGGKEKAVWQTIARGGIGLETTETPETTAEQARKPGFGKKGIALFIAAAVLAAGVAWYFLYFIKTPEYSLGLVQQAVQKHDVAAFNKHVDLEGLVSRGFDDLIESALAQDENLDEMQKNMALGFAKLMKGAVVTECKGAVTRYVETGSWNAADGQQAQKKLDAGQVADKTGLKDSAYRGIAYTNREGATATVGVRLFNEKRKQEIVVDVRMRELGDGSWQIAEIANLKKLLEEAQKESQKES